MGFIVNWHPVGDVVSLKLIIKKYDAYYLDAMDTFMDTI